MIEVENKDAGGISRRMPRPHGSDSHHAGDDRFRERHFTVAEIGELWSLSDDVVRKQFEREPGVLVIGGQATRGRRRYTTLRIPQSVADRVYRRLCNPDLTGGRARA